MTTGAETRARGASGWQGSNHAKRSRSRPGTYGAAVTAVSRMSSATPNIRPCRSGDMALEVELHPVPGGGDLHGVIAAGDLLEAAGLGEHGGELVVVVGGLVVEHDQVLGPRQLAQLHTHHIARMAP